MPIRTAIIGYGKIARDQHVPAMAADPRFELAAIATPRPPQDVDVPVFASHSDLIRPMAGRIDAVSVCTPPAARHPIVAEALAAGLHVLIEKPPAATLGEIEDMERLAQAAGRTLYAGWHSQHNPAVTAARGALAGKRVRRFAIQWFEDVRKWHPGQAWIWRPGGFGVFDPGINALSISTAILPMPLFVREARLLFPENRQTPIAASLSFVGEEGALSAELDWRYTEGERWKIEVESDDGTAIEVLNGGADLVIDGVARSPHGLGEYPSIYARFAELIDAGRSEVDREPLRIVADAFLVGRRELTDAFVD